MARRLSLSLLLFLALAFISQASAGPVTAAAAYAACQTGCNVAAATCCAAAGVTFGAVTAGVGIAPAVAACFATQGTCMAACAAMAGIAGICPTP